MTLTKRLKKLEAKRLPDKKLIVVRYPSDVEELTYRGEVYKRLEGEAEKVFIDRIVAIVEAMEDRPDFAYLVGNF